MKIVRRIQIYISNLTLALFYFYFAYSNFNTLVGGFKLSVLLLIIFNTSVIVLALTRRRPQDVTNSTFDYIISFCGTITPLLFLGMPEVHEHPTFLALQIVGISIAYVGLLSLNRSFGLVPANRGIVTTGMYKFVRHPLYAGYVLLCLGFLLQNPSSRNLTAFIVFLIFESLRLLIEERFLSQNGEYAAYMKKVRWRVIPYIW